MLFALLLHSAEAVLIQLFVQYVYDMEAVGKGDFSKAMTADFLPNTRKGFIAVGTSVNLTIVGVFLIKLNFLLFFRRLGKNISKFNIAWWAILVFTVGITITQIAQEMFGCFFGDITYILGSHCTDKGALNHVLISSVFSATADALSDIFSKSIITMNRMYV